MNKTLFWILVALNLTDCVMTTLILQAGGYEANPFVDWFLVHMGPLGVTVPKLLPLLILGVLVYKVRSPVLNRGLYFVAGVYATLVVYQFGLYF